MTTIVPCSTLPNNGIGWEWSGTTPPSANSTLCNLISAFPFGYLRESPSIVSEPTKTSCTSTGDSAAAQRPAMIAHLDEVRGFMEELSPELGVTDPVSGNIVSKVGYHDWQLIQNK